MVLEVAAGWVTGLGPIKEPIIEMRFHTETEQHQWETWRLWVRVMRWDAQSKWWPGRS